ncbi:MAG: cytochrome C, partial [Pseudomonadota bacterium]
HVIYNSKKGDFTLGENVVPGYVWFNGKVNYTLVGDRVDPSSGLVQINRFEGSPYDGASVIWPVKVFYGVQPYDPVNKSLVVPHLAGNDDTAYWKNFNWERAVRTGMQYVNAPFSGKVDFVRTEMYWPITHMVAPAADALGCADCHATRGRLEGVDGVYIPGRDANVLVDMIGFTLAAVALLGVLIHGGLRVVLATRKR